MVHPFVVVFAAMLIAGAPARAADALKPLRTIVYDVAYSTSVARREQTSGFSNSTLSGSTSSMSSGHGEVERHLTSDERGTLTVAIVAASKDGGLVADVAFAGKSTAQSPVRVAIFADGRLSYNPNTPLCPEALRVLPFLARGLVAEHQMSAGESWSVPFASPASGSTTYTIDRVDGERAVIAIDENMIVRGASSFTEHAEGKTTYATDILSPITLELSSRTRRDVSPQETDTTDTHVLATLVSDSFQQR
jgi:hypothetical protein